MTDIQHKSTERENATAKAQAPGQVAEEELRPQEAALPDTVAAPGDPGDLTQRHAAVLSDPRMLQRSVNQRAAIMRTLQRGYGNGHVARVMAKAQGDAPIRRKEDTPETGDAPTPEQKEAALKAAAAAQAAAAAAKTKGDGQTSDAKAAAGGEKALGDAHKQKAVAATGEAKAAAAEGAQASQAAAAAQPLAASAPAPEAPVAAPIAAAPQPGRAPASASEDAGFQKVVGKVKTTGAKKRAHQPAASKAAAAQSAAESPAAELTSQAQSNQVGQMQQAETPPFDAAGFKGKLMERISAMAPKNAQEADSFKEDGKLSGVKGQMQGDVKAESAQSRGPVAEATSAAPDPSSVTPRNPTPLEAEAPGAQPSDLEGEAAAPKPKTNEEVEKPLQEGPKQVEQQMAEADVSEETLRNSNEPEFQAAVEAKDTAKAHSETGPQEYRQAESAQIQSAQGEADATSQAGADSMHATRAQALQQVGGQQTQTKSKDEQDRAKIAGDIQGIYAETKGKVEGILGGIDDKVTQAFDSGAEAAKQTFENFVDQRMTAFKEERYGGWFGWARWAKDKIAGMPGEVNVFYSEGRSLYLKEMDAVVDRVVAIIGAAITEAKAAIADGKRRINEYVAKLPTNLRKIGQESATEIQGKFDELEQNVQAKQDGLIDTLASKYNENLQAIDARIDELKAANKGLVDKAIDAIGGVIKTILQLKDMLLGVLAKAADAIGKIIKDPIGFLGNLISGVKLGLQNFLGNIGTHLKKGLMGWLFGELAAGGIELPASFDMKGILTLVMQIMGLTWANLRARVAKAVGEPVMKAMEGAFDIFKIVKDQGIGGLWEYIKDQVGNLKDMVMDGIKDLVINQVIQAGIQWLMGILGGPAGAFIKAAKAIIDIVMWFVNNGSRVMALVNSVLDSVSAIANGAVDSAAKFIEDSLGKAVPIMISFLASLLGLGNLAGKIRGVIEKVQAPVNKAIDWVVGKAKGFAKKIGGKIGGKLSGKSDSPAEKEKRLQTGVMAGVAAVNRLKGRKVTAGLIKPVLAGLRMRYRLSALDPVVENNKWAVRGDVQRLTLPSDVKAGEDFSEAEEKELDSVARNFAQQINKRDREKPGVKSAFLADPIGFLRSGKVDKTGDVVEAAGAPSLIALAAEAGLTVIRNAYIEFVDSSNAVIGGRGPEIDFLVLGDRGVSEIVSAKLKPGEYKPKQDRKLLSHFVNMPLSNPDIVHYVEANFGKNRAYSRIVKANIISSLGRQSLDSFRAKYLSKVVVDTITVTSLTPGPEQNQGLQLRITDVQLLAKVADMVKKYL